MAENTLISSKPSDSGLHVQLHPLALLTISDHITRHAARQQQGQIVGALLGQQNGREISLEYAFECQTIAVSNGDILLHQAWFDERVKQFKDVHKSPVLDLVGWFTITPPSGPDGSHLPIHRQILQNFNESAVLLAFHPSLLVSTSATGAKLPLTIYESFFDGETSGDGDKLMHIDGEEQFLSIRFRELPCTIETGEAEMISVNFVAGSGGSAMAIENPPGAAATDTDSQWQPGKKNRMGRQATGTELKAADTASLLSPEEEDLIASLTTRLNAIRTLESRIRLIKSYLSSQRSSCLDKGESETKDPGSPSLSYPILRNISSLISHLSLLNPQDQESFAVESLEQANDVTLISLLGILGKSVQGMRELGKKLAIVETGKHSNTSRKQLALHGRLEEGYLTSRDGIPAGKFVS
ncbi:hypothetical protein Egran_01014 [Elaphomyces granulatus]|uniref:COP9 signalosome complex subunit 6 n=1 Tax=Elaphomyces granulatus TaxID=519963 RepID=A0A232M477_9EURO|nr:hypothetical protein Egran_01014 [Elaphomyces granulatus]